jgi:hypothetical protein
MEHASSQILPRVKTLIHWLDVVRHRALLPGGATGEIMPSATFQAMVTAI